MLLFFKTKEDAKKQLKLKVANEEIIQKQLKIKALETQQLQNELANKKADLTNLALDISRRNNFSNQLVQQLEAIQKAKPDAIAGQLRATILFTSSHLRISEDLEQFQKNIEDINQEFYQKLEAQFGQLSKTEKFLCGLIRLNLSNKDIAAIRGISSGSAKMSRHRLRKKLGLEPEVDIVRFLEGF